MINRSIFAIKLIPVEVEGLIHGAQPHLEQHKQVVQGLTPAQELIPTQGVLLLALIQTQIQVQGKIKEREQMQEYLDHKQLRLYVQLIPIT